MADYRRFISYMYLYENGRKTINSGFVRVESRNGQCRVHVHMTGIYGPDSEDYTVYMLIRENGGYIGIAAGHLRMTQPAGELDLSTDSSHLMETGYGLERVSGMVVLEKSGRIYGTRWDDEPLETECFSSSEKISDRITLFSVERQQSESILEMKSGTVQESASDEAPMLVPGSLAAESLMDVPKSVETIMEAPVVVETEISGEEQAVSEVLETEVPADESAAVETETFSEEPVAEISEEFATAATEETGREDDAHLFHDNYQEQPNVYEVLLQQYPQMYPFDDNSVEICIRLDLQDIGRLPMQCWLYGSNSFLLHGYYCYRHLILARMRLQMEDGEDGGAVYIFGVPGIRQHREQYMASMFGFRNFKPVSRENTGGGAFGYWYVQLDVGR